MTDKPKRKRAPGAGRPRIDGGLKQHTVRLRQADYALLATFDSNVSRAMRKALDELRAIRPNSTHTSPKTEDD